MSENIKEFEPLWGKWYVTDVIGEGAFGKVYKIERKEFDNTYEAALKHIRIPQSQAEVKSVLADGMSRESAERYFYTVVKSIISEFVLMSKLKGNSNIVSYEDHDVVKDKNEIGWDIFIRMELLTGLIDYIQENDISKRQIIKLGIDICRALEICQKHNIIHRDIKPENIFVSENGDFKLGDFGIARQVEKTVAGLSKKGTFTYIAPEVYKGEAYGSTVDIYSLGIVMYRLLNNNRVPFMPPYPQPITYSDREKALVKRISGMPIERPVNADGRLAEIVLKACSYNPKERYESPRLMREELESILYTEMEAGVIYPQGDKAEIHSVHYLNTAEVGTETMGFSQNTEEKTPVGNDFGETYDDETKTIGADFFTDDETKTMIPEPSPDNTEDKAKYDSIREESSVEPNKAENKEAVYSTETEPAIRPPAPVVKSGYGPDKIEDNKNIMTHNAGPHYPLPEKRFPKKLLIGIGAAAICSGAFFIFGSRSGKTTDIGAEVQETADLSGVEKHNLSIKNVDISAGSRNTVYRNADGTVVSLGDSSFGQDSLEDWSNIMAVSAGYAHNVGLKSDGTVVAVGRNTKGECNVENWSDIIQISAGGDCTVGLKSDGTVKCSGVYSCYEIPGNMDYIYFETPDLRNWISISSVEAGNHHIVGLKKDGTVIAVGYNQYGECDLDSWEDITAVDTGEFHTVGLKSDGTVVAAGSNENGQCNVSDWTDIVAVTAGAYYTVGLKSDGTVVAVGSDTDGQCDVSGWTDIKAISAGDFHTAGLKSDGSVLMTGNNNYGQCDLTTADETKADEASINPVNPSHIAVVDGDLCVGVKKDGTITIAEINSFSDLKDPVKSWDGIVSVAANGNDLLGLGKDGTIVSAYSGFGAYKDWKNVVSIVGKGEDFLALKDNGTVVGEYEGIEGWTDIVCIAASKKCAVGVKKDGTVEATAIRQEYNGFDFGQTNVKNWSDIISASSGSYHTVGLKKDGTVVSTKINAEKSTFDCGQTNVEGWTGIIAVAAGDFHTVGLKSDGTVVSTKLSEDLKVNCGQTDVEGWTDIAEIYAGSDWTIGVKRDGTVVAAGGEKLNKRLSKWTDIG